MSLIIRSDKLLTVNGSAIKPTVQPEPPTPPSLYTLWSAAGTHSGTLPNESSVFWRDPTKGMYKSGHDIYIPLVATSTYGVPTSWTSGGQFIPPNIAYSACSGFVFKYNVLVDWSGRTTAENQGIIGPSIHSNIWNVEPKGAYVIDRFANTTAGWYTINYTHHGAAGYSDSAGLYSRYPLTLYSGMPTLHLEAGPTATGARTTAYFTAKNVTWTASGYLAAE